MAAISIAYFDIEGHAQDPRQDYIRQVARRSPWFFHTDASGRQAGLTEVGQTSLTCKLQKVCSVAETDASFDALIANAVGGLGKRMARWVGEKWIACELVDHVSKCLAG